VQLGAGGAIACVLCNVCGQAADDGKRKLVLWQQRALTCILESEALPRRLQSAGLLLALVDQLHRPV
jgi:hypothetical protein